MGGWSRLEIFQQDLRFAWRALRQSPAFTLVAVAVLALGIGANTAIFSLFHAVLLRPLPFPDPDRVMLVFEKLPKRGVNRSDLCAANFFDLQRRSQSFGAMAILSGRGFAMTGDASPEQVAGALVSAPFFDVLGVPPERGRAFRAQDEDPGEPSVVILSHQLWQRRLGGDEAALGKTLFLNGRAHQIVGIMPRGFQGVFRSHELWTPMQLTAEERSNRSSHFLLAVGRLKPGVTPQHALAELDSIGTNLEREYPDANAGRGLRASPAHDELVGDTRSALQLLMGAVSLVLLVACANVANLLLARALARRKEMAIRRALGAGRVRVLQQLVTEGLLLVLLGVGAGLFVAWTILRALPLMIPADSSLPGLDRVVIDGPVMTGVVLIAACVSLLFGCLPAWQLFKLSPTALSERTAAGRSSGRLRSALLAIEVALSLVLLLGAGLLLRSFANLMQVQPGFRADRILTLQLHMPAEAEQAAFVQQVRQRVRASPGVEDVAAIEYLPLSGSVITRRMLVEGRPRPEVGGEAIVQRHLVSPGYFRTMGVPLRAGRDVRDADMSAGHLVAVINETMARRYWPNQNPIGQHLRLGTQASVPNAPAREIIGVVGDVRHSGLRADPRDQVYVPLGQDTWPVMHLIVRSRGADAASLIPVVKRAVWAADRNQTLPGTQTMTRIVADSMWEPRLNTAVLTAFAVVTLALALAGVYGLMLRIVGDRTAEIGIRMAMGARPGAVLALVLRQGLGPVVAGVCAGIALAIAGGRFVAAQLYGVNQVDLPTFAASVGVIVAASLLAMMHPAVRATRVDPMSALRRD